MANEPAVTVAFAGAGWMASVHGYAIDHVPGLAITKVASRDPDRAAAAAARVHADAVTYDELPAGADGVIVCTPPAQHATQALAAVRAGAGVLIEKPLCTTLAEADALVERSEEHTSEIQSLMRISYAGFCLKKKNKEDAAMKQPKFT